MMMSVQRRSFAALLIAGLMAVYASSTHAQVSGVPGDGVPDLYYFAEASEAPNGESRPAGRMLLDTDGSNFVALLLSDRDEHFFTGCILCDGGNINAPPPPGHFYAAGNINDSTQWIRAFPLAGPGPVGVFDLADGPAGLDDTYFTPIFQGPAGNSWSFRFAADDEKFFSNVTVVPEPATGSLLLMLAGPLLVNIFRRRG